MGAFDRVFVGEDVERCKGVDRRHFTNPDDFGHFGEERQRHHALVCVVIDAPHQASLVWFEQVCTLVEGRGIKEKPIMLDPEMTAVLVDATFAKQDNLFALRQRLDRNRPLF